MWVSLSLILCSDAVMSPALNYPLQMAQRSLELACVAGPISLLSGHCGPDGPWLTPPVSTSPLLVMCWSCRDQRAEWLELFTTWREVVSEKGCLIPAEMECCAKDASSLGLYPARDLEEDAESVTGAQASAWRRWLVAKC